MGTSTTLTVRLSPEVKKRLGRLAGHTKRTRSFLAGEAIADFVERELAIVEGIKRALDDMDALAAYIAADKPTAALNVLDRIEETVENLSHMPTGRQGRVAGTYE